MKLGGSGVLGGGRLGCFGCLSGELASDRGGILRMMSDLALAWAMLKLFSADGSVAGGLEEMCCCALRREVLIFRASCQKMKLSGSNVGCLIFSMVD